MPNPEFYQILGMFKDCQLMNVHVKEQGMELQFSKRCSAFYREFKTTPKAYGRITEIYALRVALMLPNVTGMEIWLENESDNKE